MLGAAFSFKCLLGPLVKIHLFRTFTCPITRSCLSSFSLRTNQMSPLSLFHRKTLKGILSLSKTAPTPAYIFSLVSYPWRGKYIVTCSPSSIVSGPIQTLKSMRLSNIFSQPLLTTAGPGQST